MKRLLSIVLVLVLALGALTSCDKLPFDLPWGEKEPETKEADIKEVVEQLNDMYEKENGESIPNGYELVASFKIGDTVFTVTWTSDNAGVKFELVDGLYVVTLPENNEGASEYKLIAKITSPAGQTATAEYTRVLTQSIGMITNPVAGTAYKFALLHGNEKAVVYFDGGNYNDYAWYLSYTTDATAAVDVYLETVEGVEGGYRLYFNKDGVKTYIVAFPRDGDTAKGTLKLDTAVPDTYYTYSTEYNTLVYTSVTGEQFYLGSSGTYKSISCSAIEYVSGATSYPARLYGPGGVEEKLPEQTLPTIPENYTSQDVVDALYQLQPGQTIDKTYEITGKVTSIKEAYSAQYSNISVWIVVEGREDKPVLVYHAKDEGGLGIENIKVGDTITARGPLTNYNGTFETGNGTFITNIVPGTGEVTPPSGDNTPAYGDPVVETAYKLQMVLPSGNVYFNGSLDAEKNSYLDTTTDLASAVEIFFETVDGGYHIYFMQDGNKTYINTAPYLKPNKAGTAYYAASHFALGAEPNCVWTYDNTLGILEVYVEIEGKTDTFFAGTYGTYTTISLSGAYYKDQIASGSQYPARLVLSDGTTPPVGDHTHNYVNGKCSCGATDPNYQPPTGEDGVMSIPDALAAPNNTVATIKGTVVGFYEEWSSFNNCSPYIADEDGNRILVFRTTTKVSLGDQITVKGTIVDYQGTNQVSNTGSVVTIDVAHVCSEYTDATCIKLATCVVCGKTTGELIDHNYVDGVCTGCGLETGETYTKVSKDWQEMADIAGVEISAGTTTYPVDGKEIAFDDNISVTFTKGGAGTAPSIFSGGVRLYQNGGTLTVKAAEGCKMTTITIHLQNNDSGDGPISVTGGTADNADAPTNYVYTITVGEDVSEVVITCTGVDKYSRLYVASIDVEYSK